MELTLSGFSRWENLTEIKCNFILFRVITLENLKAMVNGGS